MELLDNDVLLSRRKALFGILSTYHNPSAAKYNLR